MHRLPSPTPLAPSSPPPPLITAHFDLIKYGVGTIKFYHSWSFSLLVAFVLQFATGFFLVSLTVTNLDLAWFNLIALALDHYSTWILRDLHMLGANLLMLMLYLHLTKALSLDFQVHTRVASWFTGAALFLLFLAACFTGYILVCGQMSYWALIVILNLLTVIPVLDTIIVGTLLAGPFPTSWSIARVLSLHFLLGVLAFALVLLHIVFIHRGRPSSINHASDGSFTLLDVVLKDTIPILLFFPFYSIVFLRQVIHPDNWLSYCIDVTPAHVEPELYFLWLFCLLKSRSSKLVGVLFDRDRCGAFGLRFSRRAGWYGWVRPLAPIGAARSAARRASAPPPSVLLGGFSIPSPSVLESSIAVSGFARPAPPGVSRPRRFAPIVDPCVHCLFAYVRPLCAASFPSGASSRFAASIHPNRRLCTFNPPATHRLPHSLTLARRGPSRLLKL